MVIMRRTLKKTKKKPVIIGRSKVKIVKRIIKRKGLTKTQKKAVGVKGRKVLRATKKTNKFVKDNRVRKKIVRSTGFGGSGAAKTKAIKKQKKFRSAVIKAAQMIDGGYNPVMSSAHLPGKKKKKGAFRKGPRRRPGRPTGVYKYAIPGKGPVHVYEYRKWIRDQRAQARTTPDPTDDYEAEARYNEYHGREPPQQPQQMEEQYEEEHQAPQRRVPQQANQPGGPIDIMKTAPERNILRAPNVMRGELQNTAPKYNDSPADEGDRPVTNPGGEYYVEIEPASGKRILRRRPREKWSRGS